MLVSAASHRGRCWQWCRAALYGAVTTQLGPERLHHAAVTRPSRRWLHPTTPTCPEPPVTSPTGDPTHSPSPRESAAPAVPSVRAPLSSASFTSRSVRDSHRLAAAVAAVAGAGDVILLWGDVGAGKSEFARGFLRALCGRPELVVASPTYTLMMDYHHEALTVHHIDLYRLEPGHERELSVLPLRSIFQHDLSLVEWPERLGSHTPAHALSVRVRRGDSGFHRGDEGEENAPRTIELESEEPKWTTAIARWRQQCGHRVAPAQ